MPTYHLTIKGKVQGVFYRATAAKKAAELNITGWVKNTEAGDVEIMAHGSEEQLNNFIAWCKQGPPMATVNELLVEERVDSDSGRFDILK